MVRKIDRRITEFGTGRHRHSRANHLHSSIGGNEGVPMLSKRDVYRLYRMLSAVRKSVHWQSVDAAKKLRHESHVRDFIRNMQDLQDSSNTFLVLFIFATSLLVAILQLINALFVTLLLVPSAVCIAMYCLFITVSGFIHMCKRRRLLDQMAEKEDKISQAILTLERELYVASLRDDITASLSELRLLSELKEEYESLGKNGNISPDELQHELESIKEAYEGVEERIERLKSKLRRALEEETNE